MQYWAFGRSAKAGGIFRDDSDSPLNSKQPTGAQYEHLAAASVLIILPAGLLIRFCTILYANTSFSILAQESKKVAREKTKAVVEELRAMKLREAAKKIEDCVEEPLTYMAFPFEHWTRIRTNNVIERLNREIRRRTRGRKFRTDASLCSPASCGRHPVGQQEIHEHEASGGRLRGRLCCGLTTFSQRLQTNLRIILDSTNNPSPKRSNLEPTPNGIKNRKFRYQLAILL